MREHGALASSSSGAGSGESGIEPGLLRGAEHRAGLIAQVRTVFPTRLPPARPGSGQACAERYCRWSSMNISASVPMRRLV
jgi:hypothetical protein